MLNFGPFSLETKIPSYLNYLLEKIFENISYKEKLCKEKEFLSKRVQRSKDKIIKQK